MIHITKIRIFMFFGALTFLLVGCGAGNNANSSPSPSLSSSITSSSSIASSLPASSSSSSLFSSSALSSSNSSSSLSSSRSSSSSSSSLSSSASSSSSSVYTVATFAAAAAFNGDGLTIDKAGNIFVGTSKGHTVNKITPSGVVTLFATFAGGSANGSDFDSLGNLYVANEAGNIIQKITPDGVVSDYLTNVNGPGGIYIDEQDNLIVGLYGVSTTVPGAEVLKVAPDKTVTSFVSGNGLTNVVGVTGDGKGRYFAANFLTGEIFEITGGTVKQIGSAGTRVNHMKYFDGYIYMPNPFDNVVRRMDLKGNVELIAGTKGVSSSINGPASLATFSRPNSIDISADGKTIYILDFNTGDVRSISMKQ